MDLIFKFANTFVISYSNHSLIIGKMKQPAFLKKGDTVLIIATARKISLEELQPAIDVLHSWGFKTEFGPNLFKAHHQFSGTDEERASDLQWAIDHKTAKAFIIARGGYGTVRIVDKINFNSLKKFPKWLIGYSDITVLHSRFHNLKIQSIHGIMPLDFLKNHEATQSLKNALFGKSISYKIPSNTLNKSGVGEGELIGGNLSLLYALSGSADDLNTKNKILYIEDLDEYLYHIDRMMMQLKRSGKLKHLKGLIVGGMSDMKDNAVPFGKTAEEIIIDAVKDYNYPVCFGFPAGHINRNMSLYLGRKAKLRIEKSRVSFVYL